MASKVVLLISVLLSFFAVGNASVGPPDAIVGGSEAAPHSWPWQVQVLVNVGQVTLGKCGGTLIRRNVVLTAAHCSVLPGTTLQVILGQHNQFEEEPTKQEIGVETVVAHPLYNNSLLVDYDVALLFLESLPKLRDGTVKTVPRLSNKRLDKKALEPGRKCVITGWGITKFEDGLHGGSPVLREAYTQVITNKRCRRRIPSDQSLGLPDNICTLTRNQGACQGDSGGPLMCWLNKTWTQMGIVGFGLEHDGCGAGFNGFTRISVYRDWIETNLGAR